jgi:hypothetical protein
MDVSFPGMESRKNEKEKKNRNLTINVKNVTATTLAKHLMPHRIKLIQWVIYDHYYI